MPDAPRIRPEEARRRVERGEAFLLDVVGEASWRTLDSVPAGALRIPPDRIAERAAELPRERGIIAFCT